MQGVSGPAGCRRPKNDLTALFNIGCGLYVVAFSDGTKDNGLIVNPVTQVTNTSNCSVTEARVMGDKETMTYTCCQNSVMPRPDTEGRKGYVCKTCGWVYEGEPLPDDIVCPLCKHGAADFEPIA